MATFDPRTSVTPASAGLPQNPAPTGAGGPSGPVVELSRAQVINTLRFDLNYRVEQHGPSGVSRVDLWVTRNDGQRWEPWGQHTGQDATVRVNLATTGNGQPNGQPEGLYGFRLVPVSGAGLSDGAPVAGDAPDIRVVVDITPPTVELRHPHPDPTSPDTVILGWDASDRNFGTDPITLEWSDAATGPWRSVATGGEGVVQAGSVAGPAVRRLPNTGQYPWRVPPGLPPRVYLKVTARDAAGNTTERVTSSPLLIDLTKPRAKITGIGGAPAVVRP